MVARPIVVRNNFQEGFGHYKDQNTPFKIWKQIGNPGVNYTHGTGLIMSMVYYVYSKHLAVKTSVGLTKDTLKSDAILQEMQFYKTHVISLY